MSPITILTHFLLLDSAISDFLKRTFIGFLLEEIQNHKGDFIFQFLCVLENVRVAGPFSSLNQSLKYACFELKKK